MFIVNRIERNHDYVTDRFLERVEGYGNEIMNKAKEDIWKVIKKEWSD